MRVIHRLLLGSGVTIGLVVPAASADAVSSAAPLACAQPNARVTSIVIEGPTAYLGGEFTAVTDKGGATWPRAHVAAVDTTSCDLTSWSASVDGEVDALAVAGGTVYVGGSFGSVGGAPRSNLAGLDAGSASVTDFAPQVNKPVDALTTFEGRLYAGGQFGRVDGSRRARLAAFSLATGQLDSSWAPAADARVNALVAAHGRIYAGGNFTAVDGNPSVGTVAALDPATGGVVTAFRPALRVPSIALTADDSNVYSAAGGAGGRLVIYRTTGALEHPAYRTDGNLQAVAVDGGDVFAGGHFDNFCGTGGTGGSCVERKKLFEVDISSGKLGDFAPRVNSALGIWSAAVDAATHRLWVGGDFTKVGNRSTGHLAVFP